MNALRVSMDALRAGAKAVLRTPIGKPLQRRYTGVATCLMYHRLTRTPAGPHDFVPSRGLFVSEAEFEREMQYVSQHFHCLSIEEAVARLQEGTLQRRSLIVTFDDGHKDNLEIGLPILKRYNVPATIYVTTGIVDETASLWWYEHEHIVKRCASLAFEHEGRPYAFDLSTDRQKHLAYWELARLFKLLPPAKQDVLMERMRSACNVHTHVPHEALTWDDVRALGREPLVTIGAHGVTHAPLRQLSDSELVTEIHGSKQIIEQRLGHAIRHFAYPFGEAGHAGPREFAAARAAGFTSAVTTRNGHWFPRHREHLFALPRVGVYAHDTFDKFLWEIEGLDVMKQRPFAPFVAD